MANQPEKGKWGGKRPGAGRKPKLKEPITKAIVLEKSMAERIEALGHTVSEFLREAGERRLEEGW